MLTIPFRFTSNAYSSAKQFMRQHKWKCNGAKSARQGDVVNTNLIIHKTKLVCMILCQPKYQRFTYDTSSTESMWLCTYECAHASISGHLNTGRCASNKDNSGRSTVKWGKMGEKTFLSTCVMWWKLLSSRSIYVLDKVCALFLWHPVRQEWILPNPSNSSDGNSSRWNENGRSLGILPYTDMYYVIVVIIIIIFIIIIITILKVLGLLARSVLKRESSLRIMRNFNCTWTIYQPVAETWSPLWSNGQSSWLKVQRSRVRFPALPDFLRTGTTQPREYNWGATWTEK
jgi:hypothetical protein